MRKRYPLFLILAVVLVQPGVLAQKAYSVNTGTSFYYAKDFIVSESVYSGPLFFLSNSYTFPGTNAHQELEFSFQYGRIKGDFENHWKVFSPQLRYGHSYLLQRGGSFSHRLGGSFEMQGMWINSEFRTGKTIRNGRKSGYLYNFISLDYQAAYSLAPVRRLSAELHIPLISYLIRPGYSTLDPDDVLGKETAFFNVAKSGRFDSIINQPAFALNFRFEEEITEKVGYNINYFYSFLETNTDKPFSGINQKINFGVVWKL